MGFVFFIKKINAYGLDVTNISLLSQPVLEDFITTNRRRRGDEEEKHGGGGE